MAAHLAAAALTALEDDEMCQGAGKAMTEDEMCPSGNSHGVTSLGPAMDTASQSSLADTASLHSTVDDRISDILATLGSLSAELTSIASSRRLQAEVAVEEVREVPEVEEPLREGGEGSFQNQRAEGRVRLNVGGKVFLTSWDLLLQVHDTFDVPFGN